MLNTRCLIENQVKALVIGQLVDNCKISGMTIFNIDSAEEVHNLMEKDPAAKTYIFGYVIRPWVIKGGGFNAKFSGEIMV